MRTVSSRWVGARLEAGCLRAARRAPRLAISAAHTQWWRCTAGSARVRPPGPCRSLRAVCTHAAAWRAPLSCARTQVSAREKTSNTEGEITVTGAVKLSEADIQRMSRDAEDFAEEDQKAKKIAMALHNFDMETRDAQYEVNDDEVIAAAISAEDKQAVLEEVSTSRAWLSSHGADTEMEDIDKESQRFKEATKHILDKYRPQKEEPASDADAEGDEDGELDEDGDENEGAGASADDSGDELAPDASDGKDEL